MKFIKYFLSIVLLVTAVISCNEDELGSLDVLSTATAPTDVEALFSVTQDNTGVVTIAPNSVGAVAYDIYLGDETTDPLKIKQGSSASHTYAEGNYDVRIVAYGITGLTTEVTLPLVVSFKAPENLEVVIENDPAISKQVNVTATADFATMFDVYFGEDGMTEPISGTIETVVSHIYAEPGIYTIRVVAKGGAIETTEYSVEFEVTEILQPLTAAPAPPTRLDADVISMFSEKYTQTTIDMFVTDWSALTLQEEVAIEGNQTLVYRELNYAGIITETEPMDASGMEYFHFDVWSTDVNTFKTKFVDFNGTGYNGGSDNIEFELEHAITEEGKWISFDIPLADYVGIPFSDINQMVIAAAPVGTVFLDNMYFWKTPSEETNALIYDDFEGNGNIDTWFGDACGMDNEFANPYINVNNPSATVLEYNDTGGQYANVRFDASSNFDLATDSKFSLKIYVPSSSVSGSQPNQISLKMQDGTANEPWAQQTEIIKSIVLDQWQTVEFDFATDVIAGAADPLSRTDFNRVVIQINGENNNDTVIAYIDDLNYGVDTGGSTDMGQQVYDDFDDNRNINTWFGDACGMIDTFANPYVDTSNSSATVLEYNDTGGQYANVRFDVSDNFDLTSKNEFSLKIYVPSSGITGSQPNQISLKLQDGTVAEPWAQQTEIIKSIVLDQWQTVTFNFDTDVIAGASDPLSRTDFNRVVLQVNGENNTDAVIAYIDDFYYNTGTGTGAAPGGGSTGGGTSNGTQIDLPVDFESTTVDYTLTDFGENQSSLVTDPENANNTVAKVIKTAAAATWAGTTIGTETGFATNIPITLTNSKITVRVWSPDAGAPIRLKIEDANDPTHTCETEVNTTVAGGWETLEFDFTNQATGTELLSVGLNNGWVYNKASIFFNFGTDGATAGEKTYYFDDVIFIDN